MSIEHRHPVPPPFSATPAQIVAYLEEVREHTMRWDAEGVTVEEIRSKTEAPFKVSESLQVMQQ